MSKGSLGLLSAYWPEDTPRHAHIPLKTICDVTIRPIAESAPDRPALVCANGTVTYGELRQRVDRCAGALRGRCKSGTRVVSILDDPAELVVAALGAFEAQTLNLLNVESPSQEALSSFAPELMISGAQETGVASISYAETIALPAVERTQRADFRTPLLALARPDRRGEVVHNHRTLVATAIAAGAFYMLESDSRVVLLDPPITWYSLALMLAAFNRGATVWTSWGANPSPPPDRADYVVCDWNGAGKFLGPQPDLRLPSRIGAGAIVAIEGPFSISRRRRIARRLKTPVLTLLGRNDLGPVLGSHPTWFLDDAAGIPLPNVDTRPLNPADRTPVSIGWDSVADAELGVRSALAPAGGDLSEGWLQSGIRCEVDPTGLYYLHGESALRAL
ncbi:MAG TPA: AMP-binding protein [Candidatus Binataceae bacterium]|nr:AMP-binding protein [Candidatus Binataceae bacterium]